MIRIISAICVLLPFLTTEARADWGTTRPSMKVAVVPFTVHGDAGREWLGRAMQEGLATGMRQVSGVIVAGLAPADAAGAIYMSKSTNADAVIFGNIQVISGQIRISGQIIATDTGESLGTLRSDGSERDLFNLEDVLSSRVERILMPSPANHAAAGPAVALELVGPTVGPTTSRYFDGNLMGQINPPDRYRDQYDKYYYYSGDTSAFGYWCGRPWGAWGCGIGCGAIGCPVIATPVSGW
jgi:TolB-like protein